MRVTTWNGPTEQLFIVVDDDQSSWTLPTRNAEPVEGSRPPEKALVATACTDTIAGEVAPEPPEDGPLDGSGRFICTSTGWNERLDCGMSICPFCRTVAEPEPIVDIPATVNDGVNTDRCIDTVTSPAFVIDRARARCHQWCDHRDRK